MEEWNGELTRFFAGAAGSLCYGILRPNPKWSRWIGNATLGIAASFFFSPLICDWQKWEGVHATNAVAAIMGLTGVILLRETVDFAESKGAKAWLRRRLGLEELPPAGPAPPAGPP